MALVPDVDMAAPSFPPEMEPIIFSMPDYSPDTRLNVLGQEFHLHSAYLKMHSAFFRKFLDSPEKNLRVSSAAMSTSFPYEWITKIDADGTWSLIWAGSTSKSESAYEFTGQKELEISAFTILLRAIYSWPVTFDSAAQFCLATKLADYYRALPVLSNACDAAFLRSINFRWEILDKSIDLLEAAIKLRNETLYRECMILVIGPWNAPKYEEIGDPKVKQLAASAHHSLCRMVLFAQKSLSEGAVKGSYPELYRDTEERRIKKNLSYNREAGLVLPRLYRDLVDDLQADNNLYEICVLGPLTESNLTLYPALGPMLKRNDWCDDYFLCLELKDDDVPWDRNEREW